ncbi:MAG: hypothetical protein QOD99_1566 [Chthoniobacter sp.]|nr:hypothetical protein [Chthoniobacter sp.]
MKKALLGLVIAGVASSAMAQNFVAPLRRTQQVTPPPYSQRIIRDGGLQRAARMGNPAQALNPLAPAEYGTGAQYIEYRENEPFFRPRDPSREHPVALRLFAFEF